MIPTNKVSEELDKLSDADIIPKRTLEGIAGKLLLLIVTALILIGILAVYSSGSSWGEKYLGKSSEYFLGRQLLFSLIGVFFIFFIGRYDYTKLEKAALPILAISLLSLSALLVLKAFGFIEGAARWFELGPFSVQVSEFSLYAMIFFLASFASKKTTNIEDLYTGYFPMILCVSLTAGLIALEPNFSSAFISALIGGMIIFLCGARIKHLIISSVALLVVAIIFLIQEPYRMKRVLTYIGLGDADSSLQIEQSLIGIGSGGIFGIGIGESLQRDFLPLSYNDFIFAIIGEELGFVGGLFIILLYTIFVICGISISHEAKTKFGKLLALGIVISIATLAIMHISVSLGILPTTGIVLPFISYGGSAMISNCIAIGLLISISRREKKKARSSSFVDREKKTPPKNLNSNEISTSSSKKETGDDFAKAIK